jgi:circadian clock protein KaiC
MNKRIKATELTLCKQVVSKPGKVTIHKLPTGVRGLDDVVGGGIPEFSFNIIAG